MKKKNVIRRSSCLLWICIMYGLSLPAQNAIIQYQFQGVNDEFADEYASDIIAEAIKQSRVQADVTLNYVLTYEQKTLKMSYSATKYQIKGETQQENADLYSDLGNFVRATMTKSLIELEAAVKKVNAETQPTKYNVKPAVTEAGSLPQQVSSPTINETSFQSTDAISSEIRKNILAQTNRPNNKIVSQKIAGKLVTFTTLKSGLIAELSDEGILKINGTGRMLKEDELWLAKFRSYVVAVEVSEGITDVTGFQYFKDLEYVLLPSTVQSISSYAFRKCDNLLLINIPDAVRDIGSAAFQDCESLTSLVLPDGISNIGDKAFKGCKRLKSINLPSISIIAESVFEDCHSLESIIIPSSVSQIRKNAFNNCRSITKLYLPDNVISLDKDCFQDMRMLLEVRLPEQLTVIPSGAFESCKSLSSIVIPPSVRVISEYAFKECERLTQVTILGNNVQSLGLSCFAKCEALTTIYLHSQYPPVCNDIFDDKGKGVSTRIVIMVPNASLQLYRDFVFWKLLTVRSM